MKKKFKRMTKLPKGKGPSPIWLLILIFGAILGYLFWFNNVNRDRQPIKFSTFLQQVDADNVQSVSVQEQQVQGSFKKPVRFEREGQVKQVKDFETVIVATNELWNSLYKHKISMEIYPKQSTGFGSYLIFSFFLFLIGMLFFMYFMRQKQHAN